MIDPKLTITVSGEPGLGAAPLAQLIAELLHERGVTPTMSKFRGHNVFEVDAREVHGLLSRNFQEQRAAANEVPLEVL
jgi:nucleoside-triphosphatase THEP1